MAGEKRRYLIPAIIIAVIAILAAIGRGDSETVIRKINSNTKVQIVGSAALIIEKDSSNGNYHLSVINVALPNAAEWQLPFPVTDYKLFENSPRAAVQDLNGQIELILFNNPDSVKIIKPLNFKTDYFSRGLHSVEFSAGHAWAMQTADDSLHLFNLNSGRNLSLPRAFDVNAVEFKRPVDFSEFKCRFSPAGNFICRRIYNSRNDITTYNLYSLDNAKTSIVELKGIYGEPVFLMNDSLVFFKLVRDNYIKKYLIKTSEFRQDQSCEEVQRKTQGGCMTDSINQILLSPNRKWAVEINADQLGLYAIDASRPRMTLLESIYWPGRVRCHFIDDNCCVLTSPIGKSAVCRFSNKERAHGVVSFAEFSAGGRQIYKALLSADRKYLGAMTVSGDLAVFEFSNDSLRFKEIWKNPYQSVKDFMWSPSRSGLIYYTDTQVFSWSAADSSPKPLLSRVNPGVIRNVVLQGENDVVVVVTEKEIIKIESGHNLGKFIPGLQPGGKLNACSMPISN